MLKKNSNLNLNKNKRFQYISLKIGMHVEHNVENIPSFFFCENPLNF